MNEKDPSECLNPNVNNLWERQKTWFDAAAAQSSVGKTNPNLPEALLGPLVTVLDPCTLHESLHSQIDWRVVEPRVVKLTVTAKKILEPAKPPIRLGTDPETSDPDFSSDGGGGAISQRSTPVYRPQFGENEEQDNQPENVEFENARIELSDREKNNFVDEIVDLIRVIKKYKEPSYSSSKTWIDRLMIEKVTKQLVLIQSYLPGVVTVEDMISALLFEYGTEIVDNLLVEMPENVVTIVNFLTTSTFQGSKGKYRNLAIGKVLERYPYFVHRIIEKFAKSRGECTFACRLAVDHLNDKQFLLFLEPILTDKESILATTALKNSGKQLVPMIINRLVRMADRINDFQLNAPPGTPCPELGLAPWCSRLSFCLVEFLYTSTDPWKEHEIVTITRFVFRTTTKPFSSAPASSLPAITEDNDEPMDFAESLDSVVPDSEPENQVTPRPKIEKGEKVDQSPFGDAHETFVLSALIAIPQFTQYPINNTGAVLPPDRAVDNWLEVARKRVLVGDKIFSTFAANLIYVHSCIMASRIDELAEFASNGMKQKVELSSRHNHSLVLKNAFGSRCMTEIEVAKRSICQIVTKGLGGDKSESLSLKSIHALQSSGVYKTFQIDIGAWLEDQLDNITVPASELLADVVDGFGASSAHHKGRGLTNEFIQNAFLGDMFDVRTIPKRLFVLLYVCAYREMAQRHDASMRNLNFDISIFRKIPVRYLLSYMEQHHENFENVRSKIITRSALIFPYMMPTPVAMDLVANHQHNAEVGIIEEEEIGSDREKRLKDLSESKDLAKVLQTIDRCPLRDQVAALPIVLDIFMKSLDPSTPQGYERFLISIFNRYEQLIPRMLFETSANLWLQEDDIRVEEVMKIPSLLFRCDRRILSSPPHFHCFVRCINFFNKMIRTENRLKMLQAVQKVIASTQGVRGATNKFFSSHGAEQEKKEKELLSGAFLDTQHSVLIHALIECCDSKRMGDDPSDFALAERRKEIKKIACQYMHRTFLDYDGLIRVVLYQKFPLRQVRDLVDAIPALFAGNSLVLEMLTLTDQQRRFFAVVFAAEICKKYRVRESLETARVVCDIVHSLHKFGQLPSSNKLWKHVAPALMLLATEFPSLSDSITRLLTRVVATAKNRLAVRSGFLAGDPQHDEYQLIDTISSFLDRNSISETL